MPKLMIMAGGTGGHIFPGIAVAEALPKNWEVIWLGTADRMEADIIPKHNIPFFTIEIKGIRGNGLLRMLALPLTLAKAVYQAYRIILHEQPDAVLGMGGYASGPGGIATKLAGLPLYLHEQNAVLGMTNRWLSKIANHLFTGFPLSNTGTLVGNPVRQAFGQIPEPIQRTISDKLSILVVGGSLGAKVLNETLPEIFSEIGGFVVVHQCGKGNTQKVTANYASALKSTNNASASENEIVLTDFIDDMASAFAQADIIICRAGALTVAEVAMAGRTAIFVPLPSAVNDHQTRNAEYLSLNDAAYLVPQAQIKPQIREILTTLKAAPNKSFDKSILVKSYARFAAAEKIVTHIIDNTVVRT
ncbi:undecaprenyldiphospho-muramoylpentapeptide beta-N-acetylglucosaminyltransferase [Opacimonas viscosa]|uniref:UDP-N-acetylglucosamine--N-acetylmuramyl-(pentapeptide) pyrophosphoryl-undecaprenol N-acetylglucosamine transferase n=1 Tax=Opacimonas viscosa TaxID=2961944 RepID=A0AA42BLV9_9ALTE|nr:undecaprenyldiphospho-muramoylpentapeptide beta-N-acetylglucosaminyltransferase [Opacimonas viscosa]MCP3427972.1 undecaprenyldiphospho-muramoylpentapeptide beta-N-acetylglucosaminyltransferase [Opacimonas viscosa]